jgi:hypothetical protein
MESSHVSIEDHEQTKKYLSAPRRFNDAWQNRVNFGLSVTRGEMISSDGARDTKAPRRKAR